MTRAFAAPVAFLVVATVAVGVVRAQLRHHRAPAAVRHVVAKAKPKRTPTPAKRYYVVRAGDTLSGIASRTHRSLATLQELNPQVQPTALFLGEKIRLK